MSFNQIADGVYAIRREDLSEVEKLPVGTYNIGMTMEHGFVVKRTTDFVLPEKIYGNNPHLVKTMKHRFLEERAGKVTTAVLSGLKGSGKTLAAKQFANQCREEHGISTFLVSGQFSGVSFNTFLTELQEAQGGPIIVLIDEFEKIYTDQDHINALLSLLDGTATLHMAVMLTMNTSLDERRFEFFKNRPGRAYFNKHFETCPEIVIREYCLDNLKNIELLEQVVNFSYRFQAFTLDLLTTLVTEINITEGKVDFADICDYVNIKPDLAGGAESYITRVMNSKTMMPLSADRAASVRVDYDFAEDVLGYSNAHTAIYIHPGEDNFDLVRSLHHSVAERDKEDVQKLGAVFKVREGVMLEVGYSAKSIPDPENEGAEKSVREFAYYKLLYTCAIQHPDQDPVESGTVGRVDHANRKITFELPEVEYALILESRNRRIDKKRRLIL